MKIKGSNLSNVKLINRALIMRLLYFQGPLSRIDLANITGLTQPTITNIINDLIKTNLIIELGPEETISGRRPISLELNKKYINAIAVNISRYGFSTALVNMNGDVLFEYTGSSVTSNNKLHVLNKINENISRIIKNFSDKKIIGIGIGTPGPVDIEKGMILTPPNFKGWENTSLIEEIGKKHSLPLFNDNVANVCARAEKYFGKAKCIENYMYMMVDECIGAGIILHDDLFRGGSGHSCEIGHVTIDINGPQCDCGNVGCLELYATVTSLVNRIRKIKNNPDLSWDDVVSLARNGDDDALKALDETVKYLSCSMISSINTFDIDAIFLGGDISLASDLIIDKLKKSIEDHSIVRNIHKVDIIPSELSNAPIIGASTIVFDKLMSGTLSLE